MKIETNLKKDRTKLFEIFRLTFFNLQEKQLELVLKGRSGTQHNAT
jgi:hypothetical protein